MNTTIKLPRKRVSRTMTLRYSEKETISKLAELYELPRLLVKIIYYKHGTDIAVTKLELKLINEVKNSLNFINDYNFCY